MMIIDPLNDMLLIALPEYPMFACKCHQNRHDECDRQKRPHACNSHSRSVEDLFASTTDMSILASDRSLGDGHPHSLPPPADSSWGL